MRDVVQVVSVVLTLVAGITSIGGARGARAGGFGAVMPAVAAAQAEPRSDSSRALSGRSRQPLEAAVLDAAIGRAVGQLTRSVDDDGRFTYRANLDGRRMVGKYNVVRHAGSLYALEKALERLERWPKRAELSRAIVRGARYMRTRYLHPIPTRQGIAAIFSIPGEEKLASGPQAKLGAAGLGLVALIGAAKLDATILPREKLLELGRFILMMQRRDGSFHSKYSGDAGLMNGFESLYYPGEAILGLIRLYQMDADERWLRAAANGAAYLIRSRAGEKRLPADHWMMIAGRELLPLLPRLRAAPVTAADLREAVTALGKSMLRAQERVAKLRPDMAGSFVLDGRSAPTATDLEGLIAVYAMLDPKTQVAKRLRIRRGIESGVSFLLRCQVSGGDLDGGFLRAWKKLPGHSDSFNARQSEVRIDYTQHALCALLGAR